MGPGTFDRQQTQQEPDKMKLVILADRAAFESALACARTQGSEPPKGLAAPAYSKLLGLIGEAWDAIEAALRQVFVFGVERGREAVDAAIALTEELAKKAGDQVRQFHDAIVERLRSYESAFVESTLGRVRSSLSVGGAPFHLDGIEVSQKVLLSGSLKATITEVCSLSTGGETTIVTRYSARR
jgi:hypothetical protein